MKDIIIKRRKELGLTQQELADKLYISDKVVSKWETGKSIPDTSILLELSKALEISLDELLNSSNDNEKTNDKVDCNLKIKYSNIMIISITLAVISAVLVSIGLIVHYKYHLWHDDYFSNRWLPIILYTIAIVLVIISVGYFIYSRNKLMLIYSSSNYNDIDKINAKRLLIVYYIAAVIVTFVKVYTNSFEEGNIWSLLVILLVTLIFAVIEFVIYLLLFNLYKKYLNK